jgi:hypothetical protein
MHDMYDIILHNAEPAALCAVSPFDHLADTLDLVLRVKVCLIPCQERLKWHF